MFTRYIIVIGSSVTISGFTILGSDLSGIYASGGLNNDLSACKIIGNNLINAGIDVADGAYVFGGINPSNKLQNTISGNNITGQGIFVESSNTEVSDNNVANNPYHTGIVAYYTSNVTIKGNNISNNREGKIAIVPQKTQNSFVPTNSSSITKKWKNYQYT